MKSFKNSITACLLVGASTLAQAGVIFSDNFNSENGGVGALNYNSFSNWSVLEGTVDLIGNGYFDFLPGNGLYVDLDGSTGNAGIMTHLEWLNPGDYTLSFDLAGNHRNTAQEFTTVTASILLGQGTGASQTFSLTQNAGFTNFSLNFSLTDLLPFNGVLFSFGAAGGDNIGMLLDNVVLQNKVARVPEPGSLALLAAGMLGLGFARRANRK